MSTIKDRNYQVAFHDAVFNQWGLIPCNLEEKHADLIDSLGHSPFPKNEGVSKRTLGNLATSGGKTIIAARVIETATRLGMRGVFMADSDELCQQPLDKFYRTIGVMAGLEKASSKTPRSSQIVVASAQTIARPRRQEEFIARWGIPDFVIVDEAHRGTPRADKILSTFGPNCYVLAITATDFRAGLKDLSKYYETVCFRLNTLDLINEGYIPPITIQNIPIQIDLSKVKTKRGTEGKDYDLDELDDIISPYYAELIEAWKEHGGGRQTIAFHPLIRSSEKWVAMCLEAGIHAEHIDGNSDDRREKLERYERQEFPMLSCSSLLTTGWDCPPCSVLLPLRPTQSRALYQQMVGRTARVLPGIVEHLATKEERIAAIAASAKPNCLILDPMWMTEELGLVGPGHLIADNPDDAEALNKKLREKKTPEEIAEIAAEIQRQREEKLRAELAAKALRKASLKDAREIGMMLHNKEIMAFEPMQEWEARPITANQTAMLEKVGVDPESITCMGHASQVLDAIVSRQSKGLAPLEAIEPMRKLGHPKPETATLEEAIKLLKFDFPMTFGKKHYGLPMSLVPGGFWWWMFERYKAGELYSHEKLHPAAFRYMKHYIKTNPKKKKGN